jgi:catechol 2,3-dioxygenase-like lactoylglutathione lyase family enzyme
MHSLRVIETCLYSSDLAAAEEFYRVVLELDVLSKVDGRHVFFRCGDGVFLLFNPNATSAPGGAVPPHGAQGPGHIAFAIAGAEVPAWRERLHQRGVAIEAELTWPSGGQSLYFRDPSGNSVELTTPRTWGLPK